MASCYSYESERQRVKKKNERDREVAKVVNSEDETLRKLSKI